MAGLNYGKTFRRFTAEKFPENEGVYFSEVSKKWVVRVKNESNDKGLKPFISVAQFENEEDANQKYQEIKNNF